MNCTLSGHPVVHPVLSPKSGKIYEKSTIASFIKENGVDPSNNEPLAVEELVNIDPEPVLPKAPSLASIPGLLSSLQTEYDSLVLENYNLRKEVHKTRAELSSALYRNDASLRVIARLAEERDEARAALSQLDARPNKKAKTASVPASAPEPAPEAPEALEAPKVLEAPEAPEPQVLPGLNIAKLKATKSKLAKARKAANKSQKKYAVSIGEPLEGAGINIANDKALVSNEEELNLVDLESGKTTQTWPDSDGEWILDQPCVFSGKTLLFKGAEAVLPALIVQVESHPAGYIVVLHEQGFTFLDTETLETIYALDFTASTFTIHPDGDFLIYADTDLLRFYSLIQQDHVLDFDAQPTYIAASQNGYLIAYATGSSLYIKDLRNDDEPKQFDTSGAIEFHPSGQFLGVAGDSTQIWQYKAKDLHLVTEDEKSTKGGAWHGNVWVSTK